MLRKGSGRFDRERGKCEALVEPPDVGLQQSAEAGLAWGGAESEMVIWRSRQGVWGIPWEWSSWEGGMED